MIRPRKVVFGLLAAGAVGAALTIPAAGAEPAADPAVEPCTAEGLAGTISSVTTNLKTYFAAHPDVNQALIDATRQPPFAAVGQFDSYFRDHPQEADEVRAIKQPLLDFQNRCELQVEPAEAFVVLSEL